MKAGGCIPHHSHVDLEEIHFLPELINGIHQLENRAVEVEQPDVIYIPKGGIHAFRNNEDVDKTHIRVRL